MTGRGSGRWRRILLALAALVLLTLAACGEKDSAVVYEGVLVCQSGSDFYFYTEDPVDEVRAQGGNVDLASRIFIVSVRENVSGGTLEVGQRIQIRHDGTNDLMSPPSLCGIHSIKVLGKAKDGEFQKGLDYFNREIKPWHLDGAAG